jgi:tRNA(Ile)-lysidine synthase TilS/MesJ
VARRRLLDSTFFVTKRIGGLAFDCGMFHDGDRVLVGLSGGFASLATLWALAARQSRTPVKVTFHPFHVPDGVFGPVEQVLPVLSGACSRMGLELLVAESAGPPAEHFRRIPHQGTLLRAAERLGAASVVLGHTWEDRALAVLFGMLAVGRPGELEPVERPPETSAAVVRPAGLVADAALKRMLREEKLAWPAPVIPHPDAATLAEIRRFLDYRKGPLTEKLRNVCNAPANRKEDYMM